MSPKKGQFDHITKGAPGNYTLNQKVAKFEDRRTKRNRDKPTQNRKAIEESKDS